MSAKVPFDIDTALPLVAAAVAGYPPAAMFELAELGYSTLFQQLIACIISIRTRDEVSLPTAIRLLDRAPTAAAIAALSPAEIAELISDSQYAGNKAAQIHAIAVATATQYGGELAADYDLLMQFKGVGPKCANLALGVSTGSARPSVDVHVHRITNRWGYVATRQPEKTMTALEQKLPQRYWVTINRLLVPFGKHICTYRRPKCSTCPLLAMCAQVGVDSHR